MYELNSYWIEYRKVYREAIFIISYKAIFVTSIYKTLEHHPLNFFLSLLLLCIYGFFFNSAYTQLPDASEWVAIASGRSQTNPRRVALFFSAPSDSHPPTFFSQCRFSNA